MCDHDYFGGGDDFVGHDGDGPTPGNGDDDDDDIVELVDLKICSPASLSTNVFKTFSGIVEKESVILDTNTVDNQSVKSVIKLTDLLYGDGRGNYWKKVIEASTKAVFRLKCIESTSVHKCLARATLRVNNNELKELNKHNHQPNIRSANDIELLKKAEIQAKKDLMPKQTPQTAVNKRKRQESGIRVKPVQFLQPRASSTPLRANTTVNQRTSSRPSTGVRVRPEAVITGSPFRHIVFRSLPNPLNMHHLKDLFTSRAYAEALKRDNMVASGNTFQGEVTNSDGDMVGFWFGNQFFLTKLENSMEIHTFGLDQLQLPESYPVSYLFTIYFIYEDVCVPVLHALLQKANQDVYTAVLQLFKDNLDFSLNGVNVLIGYNSALRKAAYSVFPFLLPKACRFHYCLSLLNQFEEFKLKSVFNRYPISFLLVKMLMALSFLPHRPRDELPHFLTLTNCWSAILKQTQQQKLYTTTALKPFFDHFQSYWMKTIGPRMISVFDVSHKMNELVEVFNSQILLLIHDSPPFWVFYESLQNLDKKNIMAFIQKKSPAAVDGHKPLQDNISKIFAMYNAQHTSVISLMEKLASVPAGLIETYLKAYYPEKDMYLSQAGCLLPDYGSNRRKVINPSVKAPVTTLRGPSILKKRPNISTPKSTPPVKKARVEGEPPETATPSTDSVPPVVDMPTESTSMDVVVIESPGPSTSSANEAKKPPITMIDLSSDDDDGIQELAPSETNDSPRITSVCTLKGDEMSMDVSVGASTSTDPLALSSILSPSQAMAKSSVDELLADGTSGGAVSETVLHDVDNEILVPSAKVYCRRFKTYIYYDGKGFWFFNQHGGKLQCVESKTSFRCTATATLTKDKPLAPIITHSTHSHGPFKTTSNVVDSEAFLVRLQEKFPVESATPGKGIISVNKSRMATSAKELTTVEPSPEASHARGSHRISSTVVNPSAKRLSLIEPSAIDESRKLGAPSGTAVDTAKPDEAQRTSRARRAGKQDLKSFYEPHDLSRLKKIFLNPVCNQYLKLKGSNVNFCQSFIRPKGGDLIGLWLCNKNFACDFVKSEKIDAVIFESLLLPCYTNLPLRQIIVTSVLSSKKITDIIYVLSLKPNYECYNAVCEILKNHLQLDMSGMKVIVGYEKYARESLSAVFATVKKESCWSHFSRAVVEMLSEFRLRHVVKSNVDAMNIIRLIVALPLLPPDKTTDYGDLSLKTGWKHINKEAARRGLTNTLKPIMDYVRFEWINRLGPEEFSLFNRINSNEGGILELNDLVEEHRSALYEATQESDRFWVFYDKLRDMEKGFRQRYAEASRGEEEIFNEDDDPDGLQKPKKSSVIISKALNDVKKGESSLAQFMSAVGTCCPIPLDEREMILPEPEKKETFDIDVDSSEENTEETKKKKGIPSLKIKRLEDFTLYYDGVGYYYHCCGTSTNKRQLRCAEKRSKSGCPGSASMFKDPPNAPIQLIKSHNHPPNTKHHIHTVPFLEAVKKRYLKNERNFKKIFDEELENFPEAAKYVTYNCVRQQVIRCARKALTPNPKDLGQMAWILQNPLHRLKWSNALQTEQALFQGIFKNSDEQVNGVWFCNVEFAQRLISDCIQYFEAVYLLELKTYQHAAMEYFITVYFIVNGKSLPILCAILADSSEDTYFNLMNALFSSFRLQCYDVPVILPFNMNMLKAAKKAGPNIKITPSWFYYNQAILKKLEDINFKIKVRNQTKNSIVRLFLALALLPPSPQEGIESVTIQKGLEHVLAEVEKHSMGKALEDFIKYYQEFWMNDITPEGFSCYKTRQLNEFVEESFLKTSVNTKILSSPWKIYTKVRSAELRTRRAFLREIKVPSTNIDRKGNPWALNDAYIEETYLKYQEGGFTFGEMVECLGSCHTGVLESILQGRTDLKMTGLPDRTPGTVAASTSGEGKSVNSAEENNIAEDGTGRDASSFDAENVSFDPQQIMMDSRENPIPSEIIHPRSKEFTVYHDGRGYYYRLAKQSKIRKYLRCVETRPPHVCRSSGYMELGPPDPPVFITRPHNHPPYVREYSNETLEFVDRVVERAMNSDEPIRRIYEDELKKNQNLRSKVGYHTVRRALYGHRRCGFPPVPPNLEAFEQLVLDPKHSKFALVRDGTAVFVQGRIVSPDGGLIGIWMANKEFVLPISRKCKLDAAGVLTVQPKITVFRHLIIVYVYTNGLCIPVLYVTVLIDSEECFLKTMETVRDDLNLNFNDIPVMVGFNSMIENATKQVFPNAEISFNWFHIIQSVLRHVEELGLIKTLTDKPEILCLLRLLVALPLLPADDDKNISLIKGWEAVLTFTDANHLFALAKPILVKFRTHWIDTIGTHAFSVFGSRMKVSSAVEELHLKTEECLKHRMPFWTLYQKIRQIEEYYREDFTSRQNEGFSKPPPEDTYWPLIEDLSRRAGNVDCSIVNILKKIACFDIKFLESLTHGLPLNYLDFIKNYSPPDEANKSQSSVAEPEVYYMTVLQDEHAGVQEGYSDIDENRLFYEINDHPIESVALRGRNNSTVYYDGRGHYYHVHHKGQKKSTMRCVENKTKYLCKCKGYMDTSVPNSPIFLLPNNHHSHVPFIRDYIDKLPTVENVKQYEMSAAKFDENEAEEAERAAQNAMIISSTEFE